MKTVMLGIRIVLLAVMCSGVLAAELKFQHHFISTNLPVTQAGVGDYGLTALVDLDRDGDLDFVIGGRPFQPSRLYWFEFQKPNAWIQHEAGTNYLSDVGLTALDVDRDGWTDLICSGVWFRNSGNPKALPFERFQFDSNAAGAHDILSADINGDGKPDVVMMGDERTALNSVRWYELDGTNHWKSHLVGPPVHGAITPGGIGDLDGDGDLDIVRANTWFENKDSKGLEWLAHDNIPMGRKGPFGICVRTFVVDMDGDGHKDIVMCDADIEDCKVVILLNEDGKGGQWSKKDLPQSFRYGSLHSFAVADLNGDGRLDIASNEQEELLPSGRENPRWIVWENL
jgi:hypothetical protein